MPEKYIQLKFKERIFTGEVVNSYSSCSQGKLGICTDLFHNCVKHFILPLLLDLAGNQYYSFNLWGCTVVLDSARTLNGSNKIFLSLHMLQNGEGALTPKVILTFSSGKRCGVSTSVMCRPPGYLAGLAMLCGFWSGLRVRTSLLIFRHSEWVKTT